MHASASLAQPTTLPPRRVGIVGGLDRAAPLLRHLAEEQRGQIELHNGHMSGPASARLRSLVRRVDLLVIVTDMNSHAAVTHARTLARRAGCPVRLVQRLGQSQLRSLFA